jgi:hypothetical protein
MKVSDLKLSWAAVGLMAAGLMTVGLGCSQMHKDKEAKEEGDEVKMSINDVPAPVRATLTQEAAGAKIDTVDKETDDGKTIYEADVMSGGKNWELKVAPDGKLLSKKLDEESEEKGEKK